jgi:integrase
MASLQARHGRDCQLGRDWTTAKDAEGCGCKPSYFVVVREGDKLHREKVGKNRRQAEQALTKRQGETDDGSWEPHKSIRFAEWGERWLVALNRKQTTKDDYRTSIDYASEAFGSKVVRRLSTEDVTRLLELLRAKGISDSTRAKHLRVLAACLSSATLHGYAATNPAKMLPKNERPHAEKREAAYFEQAELPVLFAAIEAGMLRVVMMVLLKTGIRSGEALGLEWGDVDLSSGAVHIRRALAKGALTTPKSGERRVVDIPPDLVKTLGEWWGECGKPGDDAIVFAGPTASGHLDPGAIRHELYRAMKTAGIPREGPTGEKRTVHSLRHTFASRALQSGRPITWVSRHLGHATLEITHSTYGHWERAEQKRQAEQMEGVFGV